MPASLTAGQPIAQLQGKALKCLGPQHAFQKYGQSGQVISSALPEIGKLADMVIVDANPLANLKVLYGTGAIVVDENNEVGRHGGIVYTIKDGIVYDAKQLLQDVANMVKAAKQREGFRITQPGLEY